MDIGCFYGGGIIDYIFSPNNPRYIPGEVHDLIVALDQQIGPWGCIANPINGTSTSIGSGTSNTNLIISGCNEPGIAARICSDLVANGYSDWFLPSIGELQAICGNINLINFQLTQNGGTPITEAIWSSCDQIGSGGYGAMPFACLYEVGGEGRLSLKPLRPMRKF